MNTRLLSAILIWSPFENGLLATVSTKSPVVGSKVAPVAVYLASPTDSITIEWSYALSRFCLIPLAAQLWNEWVYAPPDLIDALIIHP